jgi:hypothetical protein
MVIWTLAIPLTEKISTFIHGLSIEESLKIHPIILLEGYAKPLFCLISLNPAKMPEL